MGEDANKKIVRKAKTSYKDCINPRIHSTAEGLLQCFRNFGHVEKLIKCRRTLHLVDVCATPTTPHVFSHRTGTSAPQPEINTDGGRPRNTLALMYDMSSLEAESHMAIKSEWKVKAGHFLWRGANIKAKLVISCGGWAHLL